MATEALTRRVARFGAFEADLSNGLLTRHGRRVRIESQPFHVLALLLARPGEIVTREQVRQQLWPNGTYVDFDGSLNVALKRLRAALNDDPKDPRFIETVRKRGYRFIVPVTFDGPVTAAPNPRPAPSDLPFTPSQPSAGERTPLLRRHWTVEPIGAVATLVLVGMLVVIGIAHTRMRPQVEPIQAATQRVFRRPSVVVLGFRNLSGQSGEAWLGTALSEMLSTELAGGTDLRLVSGEDVANLRRTAPWPEVDSLDPATAARVGSALDSDYLVLGSYTVIGGPHHRQLRIDTRLQDARKGRMITEAAAVGDERNLFQIVARLGNQMRRGLGIPALQESQEVGLLASLPLDPETARFYALGFEKLRAFDASAAKDLFQQATRTDPKFSLAHVMLARAWGQLGYMQKRKMEIRNAMQLSKNLPKVQRLLVEGDYFESFGKYEQAASVYHALFELYPDSLDYGLQLARTQGEAYQTEEALETIRRLRNLASSPKEGPELDLCEADLLLHRNLERAALLYRSAATKALAQGKRLAYARAEEGLCFTNRKHLQAPPECQEAYEIFLAAGNRDEAGSSLQLMAENNRLTGHDQEAIPLYERAELTFEEAGDKGKAGVALNNLSLILENEGQWDRAEKAFGKAKENFQAVNNRRNVAVALENLADILVLRGRLRQAAGMYRQAWEIDDSTERPFDEYAHIGHASLLLMQGDFRDARLEIESEIHSLRAYGEDPWQLGAALTLLGDLERTSGNLGAARGNYQEAMDILTKAHFPSSITSISMAELATTEGRPAAADLLLRQVIAQLEQERGVGEEIGAYTSLGRGLLAQGKTAEARDAVAHALTLADLHEFPVLDLPLQILRARVAAEEVGPGVDAKGPLILAAGQLREVSRQAHRLGLYITECEARLALGEVELKLNPAAGRTQLSILASETRSRGFDLLSRKAVALLDPPISLPNRTPDHLTASASIRKH